MSRKQGTGIKRWARAFLEDRTGAMCTRAQSLHSEWDCICSITRICINCPLQLTSLMLTFFLLLLIHVAFLMWLASVNSAMELAALKFEPGMSTSFSVMSINESLTVVFSGGGIGQELFHMITHCMCLWKENGTKQTTKLILSIVNTSTVYFIGLIYTRTYTVESPLARL